MSPLKRKSAEPKASGDQNLLDRVRGLLSGVRKVKERRMFGGAGFMVRGNSCITARPRFEYTWNWFQNVRALFKRAAGENRFVLFSVDQWGGAGHRALTFIREEKTCIAFAMA